MGPPEAAAAAECHIRESDDTLFTNPDNEL